MQKLQLYIGGQRVDLFKDEEVSFNQSIQNIKDPAKIFTEFTQTFTVPASKTNNKLFKHYYNYDIVDGFDARDKVEALIELNNLTFQIGFIKLNGTELTNNKIYAYKITFFGKTVNLTDVLRDDKLSALSTLNQYTLNYDAATVKFKLQNSGDIICPLITSGEKRGDLNFSRLYYNSNTNPGNDGNLAVGGGNRHGVYWKDLKYAIRVSKIIEAIQTDYNIDFTDDFFSDTNAEFYNLYLWLHRKKGDVQPASQITTFPTEVTGFPLVDTSDPDKTIMLGTSALNVFNSCNPYGGTACPNTSLPTVQTELVLTVSGSNTSPYNVIINRNGIVWATFTNQTGSSTFDRTDFPNSMDEGSYTVTIEVTTLVTFSSITWNLAGIFNGTPWTNQYILAPSGGFPASATFEFIIQQQIPEIKIIDFLTGIFKMFNLTAYYVSDAQDPDYDKIKIQRLSEFYADGTIYDISRYVNTNKSKVNVALPYKEIDFSYEGTGTLLALQYEQLIGKRWGAEQFIGNNDIGNNFTAPNPTYKIVLPFEHVMFERLIDQSATVSFPTNITTIQYGYFADDNQDAYIGSPLLFYPIRQIASSDTDISFLNDLEGNSASISTLSSYNIPSNSLSINSTTSKININFFPESNEYGAQSDPPDNDFTDTLFQKNYFNYIQDIFNVKRRLINIEANLPLNIIKNLNMNDKVTINNQNYTINTLQTNLTTGKSSLEIINELEQDSFTISLYYSPTGTPCPTNSSRTLVTVYSDTASITFGSQNGTQTIGKLYANKELTIFAPTGNYGYGGTGSKWDKWNKINYTPTAPSLLLEGWWQSEFENGTGDYPKQCSGS
tara:strand:+ start:417 stop:2921 length:2505 start_codon:yes stop_codon:yes gene_type:complete